MCVVVILSTSLNNDDNNKLNTFIPETFFYRHFFKHGIIYLSHSEQKHIKE